MKSNIVVAGLLLFCIACNNNKDEAKPKEEAKKAAASVITETPFGNFEGKPVTEYTLTNTNGVQVGIINYGGTITKILVPDRKGEMGDVVTGFASLDGFQQKGNPYFGALIGRYGAWWQQRL
jgi:aldose 1-epimerase